jgi:thioredoxin 1
MKEVNETELINLQSSGKKILLDLYATWCGPCKMLMPSLESMSKNYPDVEFIKMDVDKNKDFAIKLGVRGVPTVVIYNGSDILDRSSGVKMESYYSQFLK